MEAARGRRGRQAGLTLIELMLMIAVIGILTGLAIPTFNGYRERAQAAEAVGAIAMLSVQVEGFRTEYAGYPNELHLAVDTAIPDDPWGNPYVYLNLQSGDPGVNGQRRKDKNLVPINSDFDMYSMGPDGDSKPALTAKPSHDDIIRANDGDYIGIAEDY